MPASGNFLPALLARTSIPDFRNALVTVFGVQPSSLAITSEDLSNSTYCNRSQSLLSLSPETLSPGFLNSHTAPTHRLAVRGETPSFPAICRVVISAYILRSSSALGFRLLVLVVEPSGDFSSARLLIAQSAAFLAFTSAVTGCVVAASALRGFQSILGVFIHALLHDGTTLSIQGSGNLCHLIYLLRICALAKNAFAASSIEPVFLTRDIAMSALIWAFVLTAPVGLTVV